MKIRETRAQDCEKIKQAICRVIPNVENVLINYAGALESTSYKRVYRVYIDNELRAKAACIEGFNEPAFCWTCEEYAKYNSVSINGHDEIAWIALTEKSDLSIRYNAAIADNDENVQHKLIKVVDSCNQLQPESCYFSTVRSLGHTRREIRFSVNTAYGIVEKLMKEIAIS